MKMENQNIWKIRSADRGFVVFIQNVIYMLGIVFTLGFGYPWLANWKFAMWSRRLVLGGRTVRYTGSPGGILGMWVKVWIFSLVTLTIYWWFSGRKAVDQYMDSHLEWNE